MEKKQTKNARYKFKHYSNFGEKLLICPKCFEVLMRDDIEHFSHCPFCDSVFEMNNELEDYILKPVIEQWLFRQGNVAPGMFLDVRDELSD